jgi:DNA-binding phage protein
MTISEFLNSHLKGATLYQVYKLSGVSQTSVRRMFDGTTNPSVESFFKVCKAIGVKESDIAKFYKGVIS